MQCDIFVDSAAAWQSDANKARKKLQKTESDVSKKLTEAGFGPTQGMSPRPHLPRESAKIQHNIQVRKSRLVQVAKAQHSALSGRVTDCQNFAEEARLMMEESNQVLNSFAEQRLAIS